VTRLAKTSKHRAKIADCSVVQTPELHEFGSAPAETATLDRRRSTREERPYQAWLSEAADRGKGAGARQQLVSVTNLSMHGVGLHAPKRLERGAAHWIVIATDRLHLSTRVRIVTVRPREDGSCDAGGEFF
jgi:hypothetical protein